MTPRRTRRSAGLGSLLLGATLVAACGSGTETEATRPDEGPEAGLFDAAQDESGVLVYSVLQDQINAALSDGYADEVGLPLTLEKISGSSVTSRYEAEAAAGAVRADVLISTDCDFIQAQVEQGVMVDMLSAEVPDYPGDYPEDFQFAGGSVPIIQMNPYGIGYNTEAVSEDEVPTSWDDLLDPRWTGRILMVSPSSSASQTQMWNYLIDSRGEDFARRLAGQAAQFYPSTGPAAEGLAAGEGDILIPTAGQVTATVAAAGAPVAFSPVDDTTTSYLCVGLSADAPSPQGARLFLDYLLSEAGSEAINGDAEQNTVGPFGVGAEMPPGLTLPEPVTPDLTARVAAVVGV